MDRTSFSDSRISRGLLDRIRSVAVKLDRVRIMEVCGTHTMEIGRLGLRSLLPDNVELVSGPGCPVCVTPGPIIDSAARLARDKGVCVLTFGDMVRVPGDISSLHAARAAGGRVEVVTSPLNAVEFAKENPRLACVFIAVGFETTIPAVCAALLRAREKGTKNLSFLIAHRLVPPALEALSADPLLQIQGLLLPGHVSAVIGADAYRNMAGPKISAAVTGFEALDILAGILSVLEMVAADEPALVNMYPRVVTDAGNRRAQELIRELFVETDAVWRGIGTIPRSGLALRNGHGEWDAALRHGLAPDSGDMPSGCSCGNVLKGRIRPDRCPLFGKKCTPETPVGPCMVSSEGSCAAYYKYSG